MTLSSIASQISGWFQRPTHIYTQSTAIFPNLNNDKLAIELRLEERAAERGQAELPATNSESFDDVELQTIDRIEGEKREAHRYFHDQLQTYGERLTALDFEGHFGEISQFMQQAVGNMRASAASGRDELFQLRRRIIETERDRETFRSAHKLQRSARISTFGGRLIKIGLLLLMGIFEVGLNGALLGKGDDMGLIGGAALAITFAILNIVVSFMLGRFGFIQLNHRQGFRKALGVISLILYAAFTVALNLSLAHFRDVSGDLIEDAGIQALRQMIASPFGLANLTSWTFFGIGVTFSLIASIDGLLFRDPYPGYEAIETHCTEAHRDYLNLKQDLIDELQTIRDYATEKMAEGEALLVRKRAEFDSILQSKARLSVAFVEFQSELQRSVRFLLSIYRDANRRARKTPPPDRFQKIHNLDSTSPATDTPNSNAREDLRKSILSVQETLKQRIVDVHREFELAFDGYRQIDDMIPDAVDGKN